MRKLRGFPLSIRLTALLILGMACQLQVANAKDDEAKVVHLVPYSAESVRIGRALFSMSCTRCHGHDGKALIDFVSDATNLTNPERWRNGNTLKDMYRSLSDGAGTDMPPFKYQFTDKNDIWHLMNWIVSNWTEEQRRNLLDK